MKALEAFLKQVGIKIPPWVAIVLALVVLLTPAVIFFVKWWRERKAKQAEAPPAAVPGAAAPETAIAPNQLRKAFLRFQEQLPSEYRRSLLNFEHFVVLGPASSGKSRVIDKLTDWKRRTKEFVSSQSVDPDLQVYLTSSAVVTEVPPNILDDHSARCRSALKNLWKPLYKHRSPTVVVVVDAMRLRESTTDGLRDLAETIRAKVNVIAAIRRAPIEVRVVLTRLDQLPGYGELVDFAAATGLPTRIPFSIPRGVDAKPDVAGDLERWFEGLRGHLPRALTLLSSDAYRRFVEFVRRVPEVSATLAPFLEVLFAHEPLAPDPTVGGVYLVAESAAPSNPLLGAADAGPGPDPRRRHLYVAAAAAGVSVLYLTIAYAQQRALWSRASAELDDYSPAAYGKEREARRRDIIADFTYRPRGVMQRFPDFFAGSRTKMRKRFSDAVREELLVPRLRQVATRGTPDDAGIALPQRRSLYYLALVHSNHDDRLRILEARRLEIWSSMTGLSSDLIRDYVSTVDTALRQPVGFDLAAHELDPSDSSASWVLFFRKVQESMSDGALSPDELDDLRARAGGLTRALDRFDHDDVTRTILDELDSAAGLGDKGGGRLKLAYQPKYSDFLQNIASSDVLGQRDALRRILSAVQKASIETSGAPLLRDLNERISLLYAAQSANRPEDVVRIKLAGQEYTFDVRKWDETLVDSQAAEEIAQFIRRNSSSASIFFKPSDDDARPIVWNPTTDGSVFFSGRASIDGRYTKPAYDKHVRDATKRLTEVLDKSKVPAERKQKLREFTKEQVRRYAAEYLRQLEAFYRGFTLTANSPVAVRTAISQIVSDTSPFNDFITAVDKQVTIEADDPLLDPMNDVANEFSAWHKAVSPAAGAPEIGEYKAILTQLLADLGPAPESTASQAPAAAAVAAAEPATNQPGQTLEKLLSPAGRLVLASLRGDEGSYGGLVAAWVQRIQLPEYQRAPFLAPIVQLSVVGRRDIDTVVDQAWEREMAPDIGRLAERFPFSREATQDVSPQELAAVLHPQAGRFFDAYRRFLEPITDVDASGYHLKKRLRGSINVPGGMFATVTQAWQISKKLWDAAGHPVPLELHIATVPFEHGPDPRLALTLTYLNVGETPVLNFNQKPTEKTVRYDWTKEQASQVGMQLTDLDTKESTFPEPLVIDASFWSFHKLLRLGTTSAVKHPPDALLYSWELKVRKGRAETSRVRFVVIGDPFQPFSLSKTPPRGRSARLSATN